MPVELDTLIGECDVKLSSREKQRLSIARTFLKNPPILISSLDIGLISLTSSSFFHRPVDLT